MPLAERVLLEKLVMLGSSFRDTPIVDDDFPYQRDRFDAALAECMEFLKNNKAPVLNTTTMIVDGCQGQQDVVVTTLRR
jgi:hypothetical protein